MEGTLGGLAVGQEGIVARVDADSAPLRRRLTEMGLTPGTRVAVRRIAPLGDPIGVSLRGYDLSLRREDALHIVLAQESAALPLRNAPEPGHTDGVQKAPADLAVRLTRRAVREAASGRACAGCPGCRIGVRRSGKNAGGARAAYPNRGAATLALVGNPNCGKTTLFNALTGARESAGNWPGVTVERKERRLRAQGYDLTVVDLPGVYSLSACSPEEAVARDFILDVRPDVIVNIVDAANLERNLYLTMQLMELERPLLLALNMMDEAAQRGVRIDCERLSAALGVPVVPICARSGQGVLALLSCLAALLGLTRRGAWPAAPAPVLRCGGALSSALGALMAAVGAAAGTAGLPACWTAMQLLEGGAPGYGRLRLNAAQQAAARESVRAFCEAEPEDLPEARIADARYRCIAGICAAAVRRAQAGGRSASERIDAVLTSRWLGLPILLLLMGAVFLLTFDTLGAYLSDGLEGLVAGLLPPQIRGALTGAGLPPWLVSLLCDGVLMGVSGVLTFLPQIALLFFFLSLLEDSGYLARAAFLMDRAFRRFGLSGKAFIPMLMGLGCTVPATLATRTLEREDDRRMTILLLPFVSCSAKLPVYGLLASVFFAAHRGLIVLSLYALGIAMGLITAALFRRTLFRNNRAPFVLELPPYRLPTLRNTLLHVGERVGHFLLRAGTVILLMSVLLWVLMHFDPRLRMTDDAAQSILGMMGGGIAPLFGPLGFPSWQAAVALLTGLVAKEAVNASLSLFLGVTGNALPAALTRLFTPLSAYCFLVFVLLYTPCIAAMATMRRELHSARHMLLLLAYQTGVAYLTASLIFALGRLFLA